eukprot:m.272871 g.272871  ORF g.272871 m.272871 type:complete len:1531 (-) comp17681_c0_seq2:1276-5868(-)
MSATSSGQQHRAPKFVYLFHDTENLHFGGATASATDIYNRTLKTAIAAITDQATADAINLTQLVVNWEFPMAQSAAQQDIATFGHSSRKQWWPSPKHIAEFRTLGVHITDMDVKKGSMDLYLRNVISDRLFELREHEVADKSKYLFVVLSGDRDFSGVVRDIVRDGYRCVCIYGATAPFAPINPALEAQADAALGEWQSICGFGAPAANAAAPFPFSLVQLQLATKFKLSPSQLSTLTEYLENTVLKLPLYKVVQDPVSFEIAVKLDTTKTKSAASRQKGVRAALEQSPISLQHIPGLSTATITSLDDPNTTVVDKPADTTAKFYDGSFDIELETAVPVDKAHFVKIKDKLVKEVGVPLKYVNQDMKTKRLYAVLHTPTTPEQRTTLFSQQGKVIDLSMVDGLSTGTIHLHRAQTPKPTIGKWSGKPKQPSKSTKPAAKSTKPAAKPVYRDDGVDIVFDAKLSLPATTLHGLQGVLSDQLGLVVSDVKATKSGTRLKLTLDKKGSTPQQRLDMLTAFEGAELPLEGVGVGRVRLIPRESPATEGTATSNELVIELTFEAYPSFPELWLSKLKKAMACISKLTVASVVKSKQDPNRVLVTLTGDLQSLVDRQAWFENRSEISIRDVAKDKLIKAKVRVVRGIASSDLPVVETKKKLSLRCSLPNFAVAHQLNLDSNLFNALRDKLEQTDSSLEVKLDGSAVRIEGCSMGQRDQLFAIVNKFAEDHLDITKLVLEKHYLAPRETRERLQQLPQLKTLPHHNVSFHVEMAGFDDLKFLLIGAPADWDLGQAKSAIETEMDIPIFRIKEHAAGELLISVRLGPGYSKDVMLKKVRKVAMKGARTIDSHHVQVKRYLKKDTTVFMVCNKGDADGSVRVEKATQAINSLGALGITVGIPAEVVTMTTESAAYLKKHLEDQAEVTVSVKDENCVVELFGTQSANDVAKKLLQGFWARLVTSDYTIVASGEHKKYMEKWCSKHLQAYLNTQLSGIDDQQGSATKDDDDDSTNQDAGTYKKHRPRGSDQPTYALQITANSSKGFDIKLTTFKSDTTIQALLERLVSRVQCFEEQSLEIPPAIHTKYSEPGKPGKLLGYLLHGFRTHAFLDNRRQGLPLLKIWAPKEELDMAVQVAKGRLKGGKQSTQTISCSCIENAALLRMPYFENDRQTLAKMLASLQVALQLAASEGAQLFTIEGEDQAVQSAADITRDWLKNKERLVVSKTYPLKHASHARFLLSTANDLVDKAKTQGVLIAEHTTSQPATKLIQAKVQQLTVEVLHCSLDQVHAAAVVNASNPTLSHAGGIATAFVKLADGDLQAQSNASVQSYGPVNGGTCRVVGRLKRGADIIHATAPRYRSHVDEITYKATINAVLSTSASKGYTSIAMPLLGAGIFDWDDARAAELVVSCLQSFAAANPTCMMRVVLFDQDRDAADALVDAIQAESDSANRGSGSGTEVSGSGTEVSQPFCLGFSDCSLPVQRLRPQVPPKLLLAHPIDLPMSGFGKRIFIEPRTDRCGFPMTMTSSFRLSVLVSKARQR